jgi:membrane-associated phospholipid phosphatase
LTWTDIHKRLSSYFNRHSEIRATWYILFPLAYCLCLGAYYVLYGRLFQFLPLVFFFIAIPIAGLLSPSRGLLKYWTPLLMILLSYEALAGTVGSLAASNGVSSLYDLDDWFWGFNLTGWIQSAFNSASLTAFTTFLYELEMPLVAFTSAAIWFVRRDYFGRYVTAITLTSYSALATFVLLPTAPPWYVGAAQNLIQGGSSTVGSNIIAWLTETIESDKFAAFPSLHGAYAIMFCYFMLKLDRRLGAVAIPVTLGILFSTLYLGQHYAIDLIGGAVYALLPCLVSERFQIFSVKADPRA